MRRVPIVATTLVGLAVAAMLGLGVWQLQRRAEKEAALTLYAANLGKPAIPFPSPPIGDTLLFRKAHAMCVEPLGWRKQGGRSINGLKGWRQIVECRTGAEGPGPLLDMGVSPDPGFVPHWRGGPVTGTITHAPDHRPLIASAFGGSGPKPLMLVSDAAAPGLEPTARPDLSSVPNNHLAYAVQWFLFAGVALVIYGLALRRRARG